MVLQVVSLETSELIELKLEEVDYWTKSTSLPSSEACTSGAANMAATNCGAPIINTTSSQPHVFI